MSASHTGPDAAITLEHVRKSFLKTSRRREVSTLKTEFIRFLTGRRKVIEPGWLIEALSDVNLVLPKGKTIGIIGRNGSGKSTLLKLMTGIYSPSAGSIHINGRISALLELGAGFHPDFTGRENIFINGIILGMSRAQLKSRVEDIIEFAELGDFIDEPVRAYSSGMFMRLAFAVATHVDPDILIIDEILSVGDQHFQHKSAAKMKEFRTGGRTIVLVTHDLSTVESWCDLAVWMDGGRVRLMGDPREVVSEYKRAVNASEASATGGVMSSPQAMLPEVAPPPPPPPSVHLRAARLQGDQPTSGAGPLHVRSDGPLEALLDYELTTATDGDFSVELHTAGGQLAFGTRFPVTSLNGTGTARLALPRLSLGEGSYELLARFTPRGSAEPEPLRAGFVVAPDASASGLARPEHRWSLTAGHTPPSAP